MGTLNKEHEQRVVTGILLVFLAHVCLSMLHNLVLMSEPQGDQNSVLKTKMACIRVTSLFHVYMEHIHVSSWEPCFNMSWTQRCIRSPYDTLSQYQNWLCQTSGEDTDLCKDILPVEKSYGNQYRKQWGEVCYPLLCILPSPPLHSLYSGMFNQFGDINRHKHNH